MPPLDWLNRAQAFTTTAPDEAATQPALPAQADLLESTISFIKTPLFACYLLFNGILGDKRPASGNVLTREVLDALLVFGEACRLGPARLEQAKVTSECQGATETSSWLRPWSSWT